MAEQSRSKGQFVQAATPHKIPKIAGSFLSVDGMVEFDTNYPQADYPVLYAQFGDTYNDGTTGAGEFKTPKAEEWGLPIKLSATFKATEDFVIYNTSNYAAAEIKGIVYTDSKKEMVTIGLVNLGLNVGIDVNRIAVNNDYIDLTFTAAVSSGNVVLTIDEPIGEDDINFDYTIYYVPCSEETKYMVRF